LRRRAGIASPRWKFQVPPCRVTARLFPICLPRVAACCC
jgi:hypothetical protein